MTKKELEERVKYLESLPAFKWQSAKGFLQEIIKDTPLEYEYETEKEERHREEIKKLLDESEGMKEEHEQEIKDLEDEKHSIQSELDDLEDEYEALKNSCVSKELLQDVIKAKDDLCKTLWHEYQFTVTECGSIEQKIPRDVIETIRDLVEKIQECE